MSDFELKNAEKNYGASDRRAKREPIIRPGLPLEWETFTERVTRLCLHRRLGEIGLSQWKHLMDQHKALTDEQLLAGVSKLEKAPAERKEWAVHRPFTPEGRKGFCEAMASLRNPNVPHIARERLLKIGESIEARQRAHGA